MTAAAHVGGRAHDLLDGRLDAADERSVREHLGTCRACATHVRDAREVRTALRRLADPGPPPELLAGLIAVAVPPVPALRTTPLAPTRAGASGPRPMGRLRTAVVGTVGLASAGALGVAAFTGVPAAPVVPTRTPPPAQVAGVGGAAARPGTSTSLGSAATSTSAGETWTTWTTGPDGVPRVGLVTTSTAVSAVFRLP